MPTDVLVNVNFPDCAPDDVKGIAITMQGKRDQDLLRIDARHDGRGNPYYWLTFARKERPKPRDGTDLSALAEQAHLGDGAAARSHRRAVHDAARRGLQMIRDWRRLLPWRRDEARDAMPPDDPKSDRAGREPAFARDESVDRMEFLLSLRRRGISDAAVLRAMDAVPREALRAAGLRRRPPMRTRRCRSPAGRPSASPMWSPT